MENRTAAIVKWYTPKRARIQKVSGFTFALVALVTMLSLKQSGLLGFFLIGLWIYTLGECGSAIAELKEKAGIKEVSPYVNIRTVVILIILVIIVILANIFMTHYVFGL